MEIILNFEELSPPKTGEQAKQLFLCILERRKHVVHYAPRFKILNHAGKI